MRSQIRSRAYRGWPCQISHAFFLWQVEDLVQTTAADGDDDEYDVLLNSDRPLTTLAAAATWVIETLAHHTHDAERWIEYVNAIAGLVQMAAYQVVAALVVVVIVFVIVTV